MLSKPATKIIIILTIILVMLLVYPLLRQFFDNNFRYFEQAEDTGYSLAARQNPYLAAQLYLESLNKIVYQVNQPINWQDISTRPANDSCVLWSGSRVGLSQSQLEGIYDWLNQGGSLVTVVTTLFDENTNSSGDKLLDQLGVRQYLTDYNRSIKLSGNVDNNDIIINEFAKGLISPRSVITSIPTSMVSDKTILEVNFDPQFRIEDAAGTASRRFASEYGNHALLYNMRQNGSVLVVTDPWLWENDDIKRLDHAHTLWYFTQQCNEIWILYNNEIPSLISYIWQYAAWFIVSLLTLLTAWLWHISYRLGPIKTNHENSRREIMEHLNAASHFLWRQKLIEEPLQLLRQDIVISLHKQKPHLAEQSDTELYKYISELVKIPVESVAWAMAGPIKYRMLEFIKMMSLLAAIRKKL